MFYFCCMQGSQHEFNGSEKSVNTFFQCTQVLVPVKAAIFSATTLYAATYFPCAKISGGWCTPA